MSLLLQPVQSAVMQHMVNTVKLGQRRSWTSERVARRIREQWGVTEALRIANDPLAQRRLGATIRKLLLHEAQTGLLADEFKDGEQLCLLVTTRDEAFRLQKKTQS